MLWIPRRCFTHSMHQCTKLHLQQLVKTIASGNSPEKFPIHALVWSTLRGFVDYEVFADDWPHFSALVLRPNPAWKPKLKTAFYSYATNYDQLRQLLADEKIVPWRKQKIIFAAFNARSVSIVKEVALQQNVQLQESSRCHVYSVTPTTRDTEHRRLLPPGFNVDHIRSSEAATVNHYWRHSDGLQSLHLIQQMAEKLPSACIRNEQGDMVSWGMCEFDGQLGKAYTLTEYRRRKFNHIISKELMWRCRDLDFTVYSYIVHDNIASLSHMGAMGDCFQHYPADTYSWLIASPVDSKL